MLALLIALDQLLNTILAGAPDETLSSRAHRMRVKGQSVWRWTAGAIDLLFSPVQRDHCHQAYLAELQRKQYPQSYWGKE